MLSLILLWAPPIATPPPAPTSEPPPALAAVEALQARVATAPADAALRCELAFALVKAARFAEAKQAATEGLVGLTRPPEPVSAPAAPAAPDSAPARTAPVPARPTPPKPAKAPKALAPCLYNRGRAHEGLGDRDAAITDYVASLALRPNETVSQRLGALVAGLQDRDPLVALALTGGTPDEVESTTVAQAGRTTWHVVSTRHQGSLSAHVIPAHTVAEWMAYAAGGPAPPVVNLVEWGQENYAARLVIDSAEPLPGLRARDGILVAVSSREAGGACGRMEGFMDFDYDAVFVVARGREGEPVVREFLERRSDCGDVASSEVEVQAHQIVVRKARGDGVEAGRFRLADLAPPGPW